MYQFRNDYSTCAHKEILKAITEAGETQFVGYGMDERTQQAKEQLKRVFHVPEGEVFFLSGGTQTNMTVISYLLKPYEAVIACETGHIQVHETGAVEGTGHKIICVRSEDGKMTCQEVSKVLKEYQGPHMVKPRLLYISNATECGSIYSKKELEELSSLAKKEGLLLFMDGARLGAALTSSKNDLSVAELARFVDVFYVGGTKNGLLFGEAVLFTKKDLAQNFEYHIKHMGAMSAKGFVLGIMFERAFRDDGLYWNLARYSNQMAEKLAKGFGELGIQCASEPVTNQIFVRVPKELATYCIETYGCEEWTQLENEIVIRFVVSFDCKEEDLTLVLEDLQKHV